MMQQGCSSQLPKGHLGKRRSRCCHHKGASLLRLALAAGIACFAIKEEEVPHLSSAMAAMLMALVLKTLAGRLAS